MQNRALLVLSLAVFATMAGNSMVIPFLPLYVQQFHVSEFGAGLLFSVHAATRIVILPFVGRLSDRWDRKRFFFSASCVISSLLLLMSPPERSSHSSWSCLCMAQPLPSFTP